MENMKIYLQFSFEKKVLYRAMNVFVELILKPPGV